jgi:hypothetical protein
LIFNFSEAALENVTSLNTICFLSSPLPSIFTFGVRPLDLTTIRFSKSVAGLTVSPARNRFSIISKFTAAGLGRKDLKRYPRSLGIFFKISRSCGLILAPARAF